MRWNALTASLVLGLVCWTWHLPLFVLPGYFDAFGRAAPTPLDRLYGILQSAQFHPTTCSNRIPHPSSIATSPSNRADESLRLWNSIARDAPYNSPP